MVVGWYHSHPGFGCWLSGVDINTQQSFEALSERAVAVVVDPIQSVKGKVESILSLLPSTATFCLPIHIVKIYFILSRIVNYTKTFLTEEKKNTNQCIFLGIISNLFREICFYLSHII